MSFEPYINLKSSKDPTIKATLLAPSVGRPSLKLTFNSSFKEKYGLSDFYNVSLGNGEDLGGIKLEPGGTDDVSIKRAKTGPENQYVSYYITLRGVVARDSDKILSTQCNYKRVEEKIYIMLPASFIDYLDLPGPGQ